MKNLKKEINYLGVRVNYLVNQENFSSLIDYLLEKGGSKIYTVNPEFIVDSYFDSNFQKELNTSDLNIIDGTGLLFGIKTLYKNEIASQDFSAIKTFTGVDLTENLLNYANENKLSVLLIGGNSELNAYEKASKKINDKFPNIILIGSSNFRFSQDSDEATQLFIKEEMKKLGLSKIDILLVGYGHKNQEFWISRNASKIPAKLSVGVGGTIDLLAGITSRAPLWMRNLGLEWFYRLITQPSRILRIIKATLIFSYLSSVVKLKIFPKK